MLLIPIPNQIKYGEEDDDDISMIFWVYEEQKGGIQCSYDLTEDIFHINGRIRSDYTYGIPEQEEFEELFAAVGYVYDSHVYSDLKSQALEFFKQWKSYISSSDEP